MCGLDKSIWKPLTFVEFVYKHIIRMSVRWRYNNFSKRVRHFGCKGCLFDSHQKNQIQIYRYMLLNNFICQPCRSFFGEDVSEKLLRAANTSHLYDESNIDIYPAKIVSRLGLNLSFTKGIYQTRWEKIKGVLQESFFSRVGGILGTLLLGAFILPLGIRELYLPE